MFPKTEISATNAVICIKDLIMGVIVGSIWWPICIVIYIINMTLRSIVQQCYDKYYGVGKFKVTNGEDGVFGYRVKNNCNSMIQGFQIIKGEPSLLKIRQKFQEMLDEQGEDYARLKYIFTSKWGYYCWAKDEGFNIRRHIRVLDNWDVSKEADERKLMDFTGDMATQDMPADKPQWEILLLPKYRHQNGSSEKYYALVTRFSHAYSDAISYFLMVNNYIADSKSSLPMDPTKPFNVPKWAQWLVWAKVILLGPYYFVAIMVAYIFDKNIFSVSEYSKTKITGRSPSISLDVIRNIKRKSGVSVTAILYTALYSALDKCQGRIRPQEKIPSVLHLGSVMAMFPYWKERKLGNQFTLWPYSAPMVVSGGLKERLRISSEINLKGIGSPGPVFNFHLTKALGSLPQPCHYFLWKLSGCPLMLSNVPGFTTPLKIYGGEMVDGAGFIPLMTTVGIGLSTQTYCGQLRFNCVADPKVFSRRSEMQDFLDDVINELEALAGIYEVELESSDKSSFYSSQLQNDEASCDDADDEQDDDDNTIVNYDKNGNEVNVKTRDLNTTISKSLNKGNKTVTEVEEGEIMGQTKTEAWLIGKCIQSI